MQKINELHFCFLLVRAVRIMLVGWMLLGYGSRCAGWFQVGKPQSGGVVTEADDCGDAVLDDAGVLLVQEDVVAAVVAELA